MQILLCINKGFLYNYAMQLKGVGYVTTFNSDAYPECLSGRLSRTHEGKKGGSHHDLCPGREEASKKGQDTGRDRQQGHFKQDFRR